MICVPHNEGPNISSSWERVDSSLQDEGVCSAPVAASAAEPQAQLKIYRRLEDKLVWIKQAAREAREGERAA